MSALVLEGAAVATVAPERTVHMDGHVVVSGARIVAVGPGPAPDTPGARRIDAAGCLVTPGLVNTHEHLYQWVTRGLAVDDTLFDWLTALYPVWAGIDAEITGAAARGALAWLARTGCTTASDHHYVFPARRRRPARRGGGSGGGGRAAVPPDTRLDGPRSQRRRAAARRRRRGHRHDPGRDRDARSTGSTTRRRSRCCASP